MTMKEMRMPPLTVKMAIGVFIDLGDMGYSGPFGTSQT